MDPVEPISGELVIEEVDFELPSSGFAFRLVRTYRSRIEYTGPLGPAWDHSYNQRLFNLPSISFSGTLPVVGGYGDLRDTHVPPPSAAVVPNASCGPSLALSGGNGTTVTFQEISRSEGTIYYRSQASQLVLSGTETLGVITWTLKTPRGDVRHFDRYGRLARWVDSNGLGLTFSWSGTEEEALLVGVVDAEGRSVALEYDAARRLGRVVETTSGLEATYAYGADGGLHSARRADGRSESYYYDFDSSRVGGPWVAEGQLRQACATACAGSDATCTGGGACSATVEAAMSDCLGSCEPCAVTCRAECPGACGTSCLAAATPYCDTECASADQQEALKDQCRDAYDALEPKFLHPYNPQAYPVPEYCYGCADVCSDTFDSPYCTNLVGIQADQNDDGNVSVTEIETCSQSATACCIRGNDDIDLDFGPNCHSESCNLVDDVCWSNCKKTFLGFDDDPYGFHVSDCPAPGTSPTDECQASSTQICWGATCYEPEPEPHTCQTTTEWAVANGCLATATARCRTDCVDTCVDGSDEPPISGCRAPCTSQCEAACDTNCRRNDCFAACTELDLAGQCESACTTSCIAEGRAAGPTPGPEYGHPIDLNYNIKEVRDGAGQVYLTNTYGTNLGSPDFDSIIHQDFGGTGPGVGHMMRRDLVGEDELAIPPVQSPYWFGPPPETLVDSRDDFETVQICPFTCPSTSPDPHDVFVPVGDLVLVFADSQAPSLLGGYLVRQTISEPVLPTIVTFSAGSGGAVIGRIDRRTSTTNYFATTSTTLSITLDGGATVSLATSRTGDVAITGTQSGRDQLLAMSTMTLFVDASRVVRAYPGVPDEVLIVSSGSCTAPFHVRTVSQDEAVLEPATACAGEIWFTPLAGMHPIASEADQYTNEGLSALTTSAFHPTVLSPTRGGFVWRKGIEGRLVRETAPSTAGIDYAARETFTYFDQAPMLSGPSGHTTDPLYVFHQVPPDYSDRPPLPPPSDAPWEGLDPPPTTIEYVCDPMYPDPPRRGTRAAADLLGQQPPSTVPTQATIITDLHGASWTYYADERGNVLRIVAHGTATSPESVVSFNYDPIGQVIALEQPDGARTCMSYDPGGNVIRRLHMPAPTPGIPSPAPIIENYQFRADNSLPVWIGDPRYPGSPLRRFNYDAAGNPQSIVDAVGVDEAITTFALVGGNGDDPSRFQIASIAQPGGLVTSITYNPEYGTSESATVDPSGAALRTETIHDAAGRLVVYASPLGLLSTRVYGGPFLESSVWSAGDNSGSETLTYDADGQVATATVGALRTELAYDLRGEIMKVGRIATDGSAAASFDCRNVAPDSRVLETVSGEGVRVRYEHDIGGRVVKIEAGDLGPSAGTWDDGCPDHPPPPSEHDVLGTFAYDASGRLTRSTDERGLATTYVYDGHGRPIIVRRPDGHEVWRGYDALGDLIWEATYAANAVPGTYRPPSWGDSGLRAAVEIDHDRRGRIVEVRRWHFETGPIGDGVSTTRFQYRDVTRTVTRIDDANNEWTTTYDHAGRVIEERAPDGTARTYSYFNTPGNPPRVRVSEPGPAGVVTRELALTAWGSVAGEAVVVGATTHPTASTQYDDFLRPTATTSVTGGGTTTSYDAFGRVIAQSTVVPDGASETVTMAYDRDGRPRVRQSTGDDVATGGWSWSYDALGREIRAVDPGGGATTTSYVQGSTLPLTVIDPRGVRSDHTWINTNQLGLAVTDPNGPDVTLSYVWNHAGRLASAVRTDEGLPSISTSFGYDSLGGNTRESDSVLGGAWTRTALYDGRGLNTRTTVGSTSWARNFDALGRLQDVKVGTETTALAKYTYTGLGFPLTRRAGNGVETRYVYDELGRLTGQSEVKVGSPEQTLATWDWEVPLDGTPRRADFRRTNAGWDNGVFTIDAIGRLTSEDNATTNTFGLEATASTASANTAAATAFGAEVWDYVLDGRSSWAERARGTQGVTSYGRDARDALTHIAFNPTTVDARGAITSDGILSIRYDALGLVAQVTGPSGVRTYRRDALGRVVTETDGAGQVTQLAYDGPTRVLRKRPPHGDVDLNIDGAGLDEHVATLTGPARQFLHQDRRNSVYLVTDSSGAAAEWTSYTAYGEPTLRAANGTPITASSVNAQFGFNGVPHDFAMGTVDMRARMYRPVLGRFLSPDPLGLIDGTNRFAFVGARPLLFIDPFGLTERQRAAAEYWQRSNEDAAASDFQLLTSWRHDYGARERADEYERKHAWGVRHLGRAHRVGKLLVGLQLAGAGAALAPGATVLSYLLAGSTSDGGFEGTGAVVGIGVGITGPRTPLLGGGTAATEASVAAEASVGTSTQASPLRFTQTTASPKFSAEGSFAGKSINEVGTELRAGGLDVADVPVEFINLNGNRLIVNTRSSLALRQAGIPEARWNLVDRTGVPEIEENILQRLLRNGLGIEGTDFIRITGSGANASTYR